MKRDLLYAFKNIVLDNHTYLRVGDIIQTNSINFKGAEIPVLDVIESATDPLTMQLTLSGAKLFGNIYCGDDFKTVAKREQTKAINAYNKRVAMTANKPVNSARPRAGVMAAGNGNKGVNRNVNRTPASGSVSSPVNRDVADMKKLHEQLEANAYRYDYKKPKVLGDGNVYKIVAKRYQKTSNGIIVMLLLSPQKFNKHQVFWARKQFTIGQERSLYKFKKNMQRGSYTYGEFNHGWVKYIYPMPDYAVA